MENEVARSRVCAFLILVDKLSNFCLYIKMAVRFIFPQAEYENTRFPQTQQHLVLPDKSFNNLYFVVWI